MKQGKIANNLLNRSHWFASSYKAISTHRTYLNNSVSKVKSQASSQSWISVQLDQKLEMAEQSLQRSNRLLEKLASAYSLVLDKARPEEEIIMIVQLIKQERINRDKMQATIASLKDQLKFWQKRTRKFSTEKYK